MTAPWTNSMGTAARIENLHSKGLEGGDKTGWPSVDKLYTVVPGQLTIITGWPGSGKSEWLDALLVNLHHQGWKIALYSPENLPVEIHISKMMEKIAGKPFGAGPTARIPKEDLLPILEEMTGFAWVNQPDEDQLSVQGVIAAAWDWLQHFGNKKRGLVIDPWNELEHRRPKELSETEYVSQTLSHIRNWARAHNIHVWLVAHPKNVPRENGKLPIPKPDMISGSQHWWNKADACITVWRDLSEPDRQEVDVYVSKVRFKHVGRVGRATLIYDRVTGRYSESLGANLYDVKAR